MDTWNRLQKYISRGRRIAGVLLGDATYTSKLYAKVIRADGTIEDLGLVGSHKVVTNAGVAYLVDAWQGSTEMENMKYHGMGTGSTAEAATDTALVTEVETRATGSLEEGASANIFKTVGTITATAARTIWEHGIFSAATVGTLWDRTVLGTSVGLASGDSIQWTYECTCNAGG